MESISIPPVEICHVLSQTDECEFQKRDASFSEKRDVSLVQKRDVSSDVSALVEESESLPPVCEKQIGQLYKVCELGRKSMIQDENKSLFDSNHRENRKDCQINIIENCYDANHQKCINSENVSHRNIQIGNLIEKNETDADVLSKIGEN